MKKVFFHRGQSLSDFVIILSVIGLVITGMTVYIKRSVSGKLKDLTDYVISDQQAVSDTTGRTTDTESSSTLQSQEFAGGGRSFRNMEEDNVPIPDVTISDYRPLEAEE